MSEEPRPSTLDQAKSEIMVLRDLLERKVAELNQKQQDFNRKSEELYRKKEDIATRNQAIVYLKEESVDLRRQLEIHQKELRKRQEESEQLKLDLFRMGVEMARLREDNSRLSRESELRRVETVQKGLELAQRDSELAIAYGELARRDSDLATAERELAVFRGVVQSGKPGRVPQIAFQGIVESLPEAVVYLTSPTPDRSLIYLSPRAVTLLGMSTPCDSYTQFLQKHVHPNDLARLLKDQSVALARGTGFVCEYRLQRPDGRTIWLRDEVRRVRGDTPDREYLLGVCTDVTQSKLTEISLLERIGFLNRIVDNSLNGLFVLDIALRKIIFIVPRTTLLTGYTIEDLTTMTPEESNELVHPNDRYRYLRALANVVRDGRYRLIQYRLLTKKGGYIWCSTSLSVFDVSPEGRPLRIIGAFLDVSSEKAAEMALVASELRFSSLHDNMNEGFALHELVFNDLGAVVDYRILAVNLAFERLMGVRRKDVQGSLGSAFFKTERAPYLDIFAGVAQYGRPVVFESYLAPMGRYFLISVFQVDSNRFATVLLDVSDRVKAENRVRHLATVLRSLRDINHLIIHEREPDKLIRSACQSLVRERGFHSAWIVLCGEDSRPTHCQQAGQSHTQKDIEAFIQEGIEPECIREARARKDVVISACTSTLAEDGPDGNRMFSLCGPLLHEDRIYGYLNVSLSQSLTRNHEEIQLFREVCHDLAFGMYNAELEQERALNLRNLLSAKERAEAASRAKTEFLAVMGHEMRTPLNPIIGFTTLLREDEQNPERLEALNSILGASQRLLKLINNVLDFTELDQDANLPETTEFCLWELIHELLALNSSSPGGPLLTARNGIPGKGEPLGEDVVIESHKSMLVDIIQHLLENAIKYGQGKPVEISIGHHIAEDSQMIRIEIADQGHGISESIRRSLFEPFCFLDSAFNRKQEGIGLGLAICKKLTGLLRGKIGTENRPEGGALFWIEFPLLTPGRHSEPSGPIDPRGDRLNSSIPILLVEDCGDNAFLMETIIRRIGGMLHIARNGQEALELVRNTRYAIVFMDISMPVMNGMEATGFIRSQNGPNQHTPIIATSAYLSEDIKKKCITVGMNGFLGKPLTPRQVLGVIRHYRPDLFPKNQNGEPATIKVK